MKTIESIVDKEIRSRMDENELYKDLILTATSEPDVYDEVVSEASAIIEMLIKNNFDFIIELAAGYEGEDPEGNTEETDTEEAEADIFNTEVAEEDQEMLRYIMEE